MWRSLLGNEAVISMVGHEAFARGMVYARNGQVSEVHIDADNLLLTGRVQGSYRDGYQTTVQLVGGENGWTGHRGRCTCPVVQDCKHAAALLIVARTQLPDDTVERTSRLGGRAGPLGGHSGAGRRAGPDAVGGGVLGGADARLSRPPGQDHPADAPGASWPPRLVGAERGLLGGPRLSVPEPSRPTPGSAASPADRGWRGRALQSAPQPVALVGRGRQLASGPCWPMPSRSGCSSWSRVGAYHR